MNALHKITLMLLFSSTIFAAPMTTRDSVHLTRSPYMMDVNAGILSGGGAALPGINAQVRGRLNTDAPLYLGGELGMFIYSNDFSSGVVLPIMGSFSTEFLTNTDVHPTLGVSVGPVISSGSSYTTARLAMLFNPGVHIHLDSTMDLNILARLGVIGSPFVALPQIGILFAI